MAQFLGKEARDVDAELGRDQLERGQRRDGGAVLDLREVPGREAAVGSELLEGQSLPAPERLEMLADVPEVRFHEFTPSLSSFAER